MLKDFAWNAFELTGSADCYCFYKEVTDLKSESNEKLVADEAKSGI